MRNRLGYTLIELLVATASASVLMVGLSSALFVSARAIGLDEGALAQRNTADTAVSRMLSDLEEAREFVTLDPQSVRFFVPDRDGDGFDDEVHYAWSGTPGDPLRRQMNGGDFLDFLLDVRSLNFTSLTSTLPALDVTVAPLPPWPVLASSSFVRLTSDASSLSLPAPAGIADGDLLMASVVIHNVSIDSVVAPSGWTKVDLNEDANHVTYGVWLRLAGTDEPSSYGWSWSGNDQAIAVGLRITNQYFPVPITALETADGKGRDAVCPATSTTVDHSMVLRFGGFHKDEIDTIGETGLIGHTDVYMDQNDEVGSGVGYRIQTAAGGTGSASFALQASQEYRTLTVVIAPKE